MAEEWEVAVEVTSIVRDELYESFLLMCEFIGGIDDGERLRTSRGTHLEAEAVKLICEVIISRSCEKPSQIQKSRSILPVDTTSLNGQCPGIVVPPDELTRDKT